jgi:hypothetical protein
MVAKTLNRLRAKVSAINRPKPLLAPVMRTTCVLLDMEYEDREELSERKQVSFFFLRNG